MDGCPEMKMQRSAFWISLIVLLAGVCQVGLGGTRTPSGELQGLSVPIATLVLLGAAACAAWRFRRLIPPRLHWCQAAFLTTAAVGVVGLSRPELKTAIKEAVQVGEIFVIAPFVFLLLVQTAGSRPVRRAFAVVWCIVLVLYVTGGGAWLELSDAKAAAMLTVALPMGLRELRPIPKRRRLAVAVVAGLALGWGVHHAGFLLCWFAVAGVFVLLATPLRSEKRAVLLGAAACLLLSMLPIGRGGVPWSRLSPHFDDIHARRSVLELSAATRAPRRLPVGAGLGEYKRGINYLRLFDDELPHPEDTKVPRDGNTQYALTLVEAGLPAALALVLLMARPALQRSGDPVWRAAIVGAACAGLFCVVLSRGIGIWIGGTLALALPERGKSWSAYAPPALAWGLGFALLLGYNAVPGQGNLSRANAALCAALFGDEVAVAGNPDPDDPTPNPGDGGNGDGNSPEDPGGNGLLVIDFGDLGGNGAGGPIRVEAEDCVDIHPPLKVVELPDTSGGKAVVIPDKSEKGVGHAVYEVDVPEAGEYRLRAQVYWLDGCGNSIRFAAGDQSVVITSDTYGRWHTLTAVRTLTLPTGPQRLTVHNVEDGIRLDYWQLDKGE